MRIILFFLSLAVHADLSNNIDTHREKYENRKKHPYSRHVKELTVEQMKLL